MDAYLLELTELINSGRLKDKYLIGMGKYWHIAEMQKLLSNNNLSFTAIADNDEKKSGAVIGQAIVDKPENLLNPFRSDAIIIIYSPKYWNDMQHLLEIMGYSRDKNIIVLQQPKLQIIQQSVERGYALYQKLTTQYGNDVTIYICRGALGEFFIFNLFFKQFIEKEKISNYIWVGDNKGFSKLGDLFLEGRYKKLTGDETDDLVKAFTLLGTDIMNIRVLTIWQGGYIYNPNRIIYHQRFNFMDTIKVLSLGLPPDAKPEYPIFPKSNLDFNEMGLIKGKTVLFSPFSYSIRSLPANYWNELAIRLQEIGFTIAINIGDFWEMNYIKNSIPIQIPLIYGVELLEYCGYFIGARSGFCDITASANCKRIIYYPMAEDKISYDFYRIDKNYNSLSSMGLCSNIIELEYPVDNCFENGKYTKIQSKILIEKTIKYLTL